MDTLEYYENKKEFNVFVASTFSDLTRFKEQNDQTSFNKLLLKDLYQVRRYIGKRLAAALSKGNLPKGKYKVDDFVDQLFIEAYTNFFEVDSEEQLHPWLFKKADELLEETIVDEEFDDYFLKNIDDYSRPEWDAMEEKFSTDGDGDFVMIDELDDISYAKNDYVLNHVFIEDHNKELIAQLDKELGRENIRRHTTMVLHNLPLPMRTVFELATEFHFSVDEIAMIRNQSLEEVKQLLENARKTLEVSFFNRYEVKK
ncbi:sigma-70 family RNA polymerase sigma factor [Zobellia galactanivorans]|uniref:sigma-70 family RNA polymerase sigma factor n=1 Tax=Zobellia galactanivorans (strain DSM 12802 / CCUG 47099 / CIP 106680 / NCIMB 13871 / Dsij) TaxID=63186 RepID=UPI001C0664BB|nr:sigma-70 family RNA polymerase sigma factor [Zobellia galactanivorans]MBU3024491.1 sigma-70 family RNA polymerase sigma factor [Zobellia galactanivorans]MDO6807594.1 sigma-70 family RNA polymerase sigma factor [Zobellia galactanivorans]